MLKRGDRVAFKKSFRTQNFAVTTAKAKVIPSCLWFFLIFSFV